MILPLQKRKNSSKKNYRKFISSFRKKKLKKLIFFFKKYSFKELFSKRLKKFRYKIRKVKSTYKTSFISKKVIIRARITKTNIYFLLSDIFGNCIAKVSAGIFSSRPKENRTTQVLKKTITLIINTLIEKKYSVVQYYSTGNVNMKIQKIIFFSFIYYLPKCKIKTLFLQISTAHNGCRPPKKRRL
jgi:hypothetical protein